MSLRFSKSRVAPIIHVNPLENSALHLRGALESVFLSDIVIPDYNTKPAETENRKGWASWKSLLPAGLLLGTLVAVYSGVSGIFDASDTISIHFMAWVLAVTVIASLLVSGGFLAFAACELSIP